MLKRAVLYAKDLQRLTDFYAQFAGDVVEAMPGDFAVLQHDDTELTIVQIPDDIAENIHIDTPPVVRGSTPIKLAFVVLSIDDVMASIQQTGGLVEPHGQRSAFRGYEMQDVVDPEGNVLQLLQLKMA